MDDDELIVAATFPFPAEAKLAQALLEAEGIESYLGNEYTLGVDPVWQAFGGYKLMVSTSLIARAQELLNAKVTE